MNNCICGEDGYSRSHRMPPSLNTHLELSANSWYTSSHTEPDMHGLLT